MFCSQCGKENIDGTKFCVQCGSLLQTSRSIYDSTAKMLDNKQQAAVIVGDSKAINDSMKHLLLIILVFILLLIAEVNILKVYKDVLNVSVKNELHQANISFGICETNSCIYYATDALYRMDKTTNKVTKISNKPIYHMIATKSSVYGFDNNDKCYRVSDKSFDIESVKQIKRNPMDCFFVYGRCNYSVDSSGTIIKKLNSDKYNGYSVILYKGDIDVYDYGIDTALVQASMYKGYMYMILAKSMSDRSFIRVSLKTGKEELLTDDAMSGFSFMEDQIVCNDISGNFFIMNLDGSKVHECMEMDNIANAMFLCANGYVYYKDGDINYRFSINGGNKKNIGYAYYNLTEVNGGLAQVSGDKLILTDYDGNEIYTAEP